MSPALRAKFGGRIPDEHFDGLSLVERVEDLPGDAGGFYHPREAVLQVERGLGDVYYRHELGHHVWYTMLNQNQRGRLRSGYNMDIWRLQNQGRWNALGRNQHWISDYAGTDVEEAFSEAYAYWTNPSMRGINRVRRADPAFQEVLQELVPTRQ